MAKDKIQLDSEGRRLLDSAGKRVLADTDDNCCCEGGCPECPGETPTTILVTIADHVLTVGCWATNDREWIGTDFNGSYCCTRTDNPDTCCWRATIIGPELYGYALGDCSTPHEADSTITDWYVEVCRLEGEWQVRVDTDAGEETVFTDNITAADCGTGGSFTPATYNGGGGGTCTITPDGC